MKTIWIDTAPAVKEKASLEIERHDNGVNFTMVLSPYDVPQATRGYLDNEGKDYVIEFKYLTEEPTKEKSAENFARIQIGENSGRIYKIIVDMQLMKQHFVEDAAQQVEAAINRLWSPSDNRLNTCYDLTKAVICDRSKDLFAPLLKVYGAQ